MNERELIKPIQKPTNNLTENHYPQVEKSTKVDS